ncbi:trypsin, partial [Actinoplanes sp. NPDC051633]
PPVPPPPGGGPPVGGPVARPRPRRAGPAAPAPPPSPAPPGFAPVRAAAPRAAGRFSKRAAPQETQAAMRSFVAGGGGGGTGVAGGATGVEDLRALARLEAGRLREAQDRPEYERRELLADLVSRIEVLLTGTGGGAYPELVELVKRLTGDGALDDKWADALRVLDGFGGGGQSGGQSGERPARKAFWKS